MPKTPKSQSQSHQDRARKQLWERLKKAAKKTPEQRAIEFQELIA